MRANGIDEIVVVNDGSTDRTHEVAARLGVILIDLAERVGQAECDQRRPTVLPCRLGVGRRCRHDISSRGAVAQIVPLFRGRCRRRRLPTAVSPTNALADHAISSDRVRRSPSRLAVGSPTRSASCQIISGAAGYFGAKRFLQVGGWDCEVAEDAALAMKLRVNGWQLRYAPRCKSLTLRCPPTIVDLLLQRLRWDASIATIWWFKHRAILNPFSSRFTVSNLFTSLDVLMFSALMPLILPFYLFWLWSRIEESTLDPAWGGHDRAGGS